MNSKSPRNWFNSSKGFTLAEILVTMVIVGIAASAMYGVYISNIQTCSVQDQIVGLQQNLRAGLEIMGTEIRMAGYVGGGTGTASIVTANATQIVFTMDLDEDGATTGTDEYVDYALFTEGGVSKLGRRTVAGGSYAALADNIVGLDFAYTDASGAAATGANIKNVTITLLGRTAKEDPEYSSSATYAKGSGGSWGPFSDGYRRQVISTTIHCRNLL